MTSASGVQACLSPDGMPNHCVLWKCHEAKACAHGVTEVHAPRFQHTYCSQCGTDLGPGEHGVSSCCDHGNCQVEARGDKCECDRTPAEKGQR